jgi:3-deoxy-D-manno-octulosonic-acid transferase
MHVVMLAYSALLAVGLVLSAPWWLLRMATTARYREGLGQRLGRVPSGLKAAVRGKKTVWVHAVSVGEVLAASRLVGELEAALVSERGEGWRVVVSTTTRTGQALARERFGAERVFYVPLDFAWAVRAYLVALRPAALVLMESEVWPRMLWECRCAGVLVVVVNARVSDRSFARGVKVRTVWGRVLRGVGLWLAQSEEDRKRLGAMGVREGEVRAIGNLKYDVRAPRESRVAELIREVAAGRPIVVAGSTVARADNQGLSEEEMAVQAWEGRLRREFGALLVLAPRHPERFADAEIIAMEFAYARASDWNSSPTHDDEAVMNGAPREIVVLDTIGDLAAVYGVADVAFVGGSLVKRGGHNPLEPAQFGVPVVMGPSFENFRDVVGRMQAVEGIAILGQDTGVSPLRPSPPQRASALAVDAGSASGREDKLSLKDELEAKLVRLLTDREAAKAMGERGRRVFVEQQGATGRAVEAIVAMIQGAKA